MAKLDLPDPKKPDTQIGDAFVRLVRRLSIRVENIGVVRPNGVGHDVLVDLVAQDIVVGLIDLDDLLDATMDVVGKEGFDELVVMTGFPSKDLWAIVVLGSEHAHEAEPRRTVEIARIEKDRGHV